MLLSKKLARLNNTRKQWDGPIENDWEISRVHENWHLAVGEDVIITYVSPFFRGQYLCPIAVWNTRECGWFLYFISCLFVYAHWAFYYVNLDLDLDHSRVFARFLKTRITCLSALQQSPWQHQVPCKTKTWTQHSDTSSFEISTDLMSK